MHSPHCDRRDPRFGICCPSSWFAISYLPVALSADDNAPSCHAISQSSISRHRSNYFSTGDASPGADSADVVPPVPPFPNPLPPPIPPTVGMAIPTPMSSSVPSPSPYGMTSPLSFHASLFSSPTSLSSAPSFKFSLRFDRQSYHNPRSVTDCEIENGV